MSNEMVLRILSLSVNAAKRAGKIIRDVMSKGDLNIIEKAKDDLQTEADRSAQRCIIASLFKQFPNVKIIGEEGGSDINVCDDWLITEFDNDLLQLKCPPAYANCKDDDFVVWVDPLDGTSEYTHGYLEHVTVLIGIAIKDDAVGGIIHQPYFKQPSGELGRTIWGLKGLGTGGFESVDLPDDKFVITTTRTHSNSVVQNALDSLKPTEILRVGGAGFKVLQLLEGKAHAYVFASPGCKKWDTCAPEAVLEAYGGTLTDILGNHYAYNKNVDFVNKLGVLATSRNVRHDDIVSKLPNTVKEALTKVN